VFSGIFPMLEYLEMESLTKKAKYLEVLSVKPDLLLKNVLHIIQNDFKDVKPNVKIITNKEYSNFLIINVDIYVKSKKMDKYEKILSIYDVSNHCFSYFNKNNKLITSIYFELYKLYATRFIHDTNDVNDCLIEALTRRLLSSEKGDTTNFTDECYGYTKTISAIKKSFWDNNKKIVIHRPK
jgi:hypothetical protein